MCEQCGQKSVGNCIIANNYTIRKYDVRCFPDADALAQARVGPGLATPLWEFKVVPDGNNVPLTVFNVSPLTSNLTVQMISLMHRVWMSAMMFQH